MSAMLTGQKIISVLRAEKSYLNKEFGVMDIGLFGSFAKGKPHPDSDIDLLVELIAPRFNWIAGLQVYLEKKFDRKIELVRKGNPTNQRFEKRVEKETIYV
jgi:uncharacterized protein